MLELCPRCEKLHYQTDACAMNVVEAQVAQSMVEAGNALLDVVRQRGRPRIHPDRKAYKAQKERERRAKAKT